jgi:hypothetical protein
VVADITEFPTGEGSLHLAIHDLCHRGIVGWSMDQHQDVRDQPAGPAVPRELAAFMSMARG